MAKSKKESRGTLVPTFQNVIVVRDQAKDKSAGGIILPNEAQQRPQRGTVVASGVEVREVKEHDKVIFKADAGVDIDAVGQQFVVLEEKDILVILR